LFVITQNPFLKDQQKEMLLQRPGLPSLASSYNDKKVFFFLNSFLRKVFVFFGGFVSFCLFGRRGGVVCLGLFFLRVLGAIFF